MKKETTLSNNKINKIASSSKEDYWPIEWTMGSNHRYDKAHTRTDGSNNKAINKPDLERSPGNQHDKDHKVFDPLDKEFRTQWEGYDPNMKISHELPKTPQYETPSEENKQSNKNLADEKENKDCTRSSMYSLLSNTSL